MKTSRFAFLLFALALAFYVSSSLSSSLPLKRKHLPFQLHHDQTIVQEFPQAIRFKLPEEHTRKRIYHPSRKFSTTDPNRLAVIELYGMWAEYWTNISVGTPPQQLEAQVDTGSSLFAIPGAECTNCLSDDVYAISNSSTAHAIPCDDMDQCAESTEQTGPTCFQNRTCYFQSIYADQSGITGFLVNDTVLWAGLSTTAIFGNIQSETGYFETAPVDGIIGMAWGTPPMTCLPSCATPVLIS